MAANTIFTGNSPRIGTPYVEFGGGFDEERAELESPFIMLGKELPKYKEQLETIEKLKSCSTFSTELDEYTGYELLRQKPVGSYILIKCRTQPYIAFQYRKSTEENGFGSIPFQYTEETLRKVIEIAEKKISTSVIPVAIREEDIAAANSKVKEEFSNANCPNRVEQLQHEIETDGAFSNGADFRMTHMYLSGKEVGAYVLSSLEPSLWHYDPVETISPVLKRYVISRKTESGVEHAVFRLMKNGLIHYGANELYFEYSSDRNRSLWTVLKKNDVLGESVKVQGFAETAYAKF